MVDLVHHQVGVLRREAHGGLEFEDVAMGSVCAEKDALLLQPEMGVELFTNDFQLKYISTGLTAGV